MGVMKTVVTAPFKAVGWGAKQVKNAFGYESETNPIEQVITSRHIIPYKYYYESQGQKTDFVNGRLIVWKQGSDKARKKFLKELSKVA
jgi:hypothetical protein